MVESTGLPSFRKVMEDRIYAQTPSRFPINTAYTEVIFRALSSLKPHFPYLLTYIFTSHATIFLTGKQ